MLFVQRNNMSEPITICRPYCVAFLWPIFFSDTLLHMADNTYANCLNYICICGVTLVLSNVLM